MAPASIIERCTFTNYLIGCFNSCVSGGGEVDLCDFSHALVDTIQDADCVLWPAILNKYMLYDKCL